MTILPEYERQLVELAIREAPPKPSKRRRISIGALPVGLAAVLALALAGSAILVAGHRHSSTTNNSPPASVPASIRALVGQLGVLRRPENPADQRSVERYVESWGRRMTDSIIRARPVPLWARLAAVTPWGEKVFLVPFLPLSGHGTATLGVARGEQGVGACCISVDSLEAHGLELPGRVGLRTQGISGIFVVPDRVARITLLLPRQGSRSKATTGAAVVTAFVHNNVAVFQTAVRPGNRLGTWTILWYGLSGQVIMRITETRDQVRP